MVNNIQVKLPTILEVGGTILNLKLEKLRVVTWKIFSKNSYRFTFYNQIANSLKLGLKKFFENVEVRLIDETQGSDSIEFY